MAPMQAIQKIILWLAFCFACYQPASALTTIAPENRVGEILSAEYDVRATEAIIRYNTPLHPTSEYDETQNHRTGDKNRAFEGTCSLFGQFAEFLAAERGATFGGTASTDYRATFFAEHPELEGQVRVHHAVEQQVLTRFPGVVSEAEMHSLENLRGIPNAINGRLHLSQIRIEWNNFYRPFELSGTAPTQAQLLQKATEIDTKYGYLFTPPVGGVQ
jgi:hypothetical protein